MAELTFEWKHVAFAAQRSFTETYGFTGSQGLTHLEGILIRPQDQPSTTLLIFMHPASTLQLLPLPRSMADRHHHVLCAGSRYQRNDTALIMENVLLDLGAWIRAAKEDWGYQKVVLCGWSGGGSLTMLYQSEAERPTITETPAGDPIDIKGAKLIPADAVLSLAAHTSRSLLLTEWLDASVRDETDPDDREEDLDLFRPGYDNRNEPFSAEFLRSYRAAQRARMSAITERVLETLARLRSSDGREMERTFVTHRTMADPRFMDLTIDPNGRKRFWTYLGHPETVNCGPAGLGRVSTLRSWLSQWAPSHSRANSLVTAANVTVPFLALECGADDAVPQPHTGQIYAAVGSRDREMHVVEGANHYFVNQPQELASASGLISHWLRSRQFD